MIYLTEDNSLSEAPGPHLRACRAYRARASQMLGSSGWCMEPVFVSPSGMGVSAGMARHAWTNYDKGAEELCGTLFTNRHGRAMRDTDICIVLPEETCGVLQDQASSLSFARCVAYDIGAVAARWMPVQENGRIGMSEERILGRLACTSIALGAAYSGRDAALHDMSEVGAWAATSLSGISCGHADEHDHHQNLDMMARTSPAMVLLVDMIARTAYMKGISTELCLDDLPIQAQDVLSSCLGAMAPPTQRTRAKALVSS